MSSRALSVWKVQRSIELDRPEEAHIGLGGSGPGKRSVTEQINHAYAVLLSSQFQGFCRDLHSESADHLVTIATSQDFGDVLLRNLLYGRKLETGNPNPGNVGNDFGKYFAIGVQFWDEVKQLDRRSEARKARLESLNEWRNAIAHQDFTKVGTGFLKLQTVQEWRRTYNGLAITFDRVMSDRLQQLTSHQPW